MKGPRKILSEERLTAEFNGKIIGGVQRVLAGANGNFRQEVVYRGRTLGDTRSYPPDEQEKIRQEAKMLLAELAGQEPKG